MSMTASRISAADFVRNLDLLLLVLALPAFIALDAPIAGYVATAVAWLIGRAGKAAADRKRAVAIESANRNAALGLTAAAMLGRLWILAAAAVLAAALVTAFLAGEGIAQLMDGDGEAA
jgi:predicted Na+-dependent transporter